MSTKVRASLVALVLAVTGGLLLATYLKRFEEEAIGGPKTPVLVLVKTLEPGEILKDEDLVERPVPLAYLEARAVRGSDRHRVVNLRTSVPLKAQETLMWTDLVTAGEEHRDISALIKPGMRAAAIRAEGAVAAHAQPGDRVDVIATLDKPGSSVGERSAIVLLQNVLVLGRKSDGAPATGGTRDMLLSVTLPQSEVLAVASEKGKLSVALRSTDDLRVQDGVPEFSSRELLAAEVKTAPARGPRGPQSVH